MNDNPMGFLLYALFGLLFALSPIIFSVLRPVNVKWLNKPLKIANRLTLISTISAVAFFAFLVWITKADFFYVVGFSLTALAVAWRSGIQSIAPVLLICSVFLLSTKLIYWRPFPSSLPVILMTGVIFAFSFQLLSGRSSLLKQSNDNIFNYTAYLVFAGLCFFLSFSVGFYNLDEILFLSWHHWSAYIGPAELMWSGARVFYDTPLQYGLGPTSVIALGCYQDCWSSMYYIVGFANLIYAVLIAFIALRLLGKDRGVSATIVVLMATLVSCYIYTAFPPRLATPSIMPSTGGLRFLPCALLLSYLVFESDKAWAWLQKTVGHMIWGIGLLWSPESAFQVTFVWGPYYIWRSTVNDTGQFFGVMEVLKHMFVLLSIGIGFVVVFSAIYYALFSLMPSIEGFLVYIMYPQINIFLVPLSFGFSGAFLFYSFGFFVALVGFFVSIYLNNDQIYLRQVFPILLALYAVFSYYLGRSIDNNLLAIMPFMMLALFITVALPQRVELLRLVGVTMICCVIAITATFGWSSYWEPTIKAGNITNMGSKIVRDAFDFKNKETASALDRRENSRNPLVKSSDIQAASDYIWQNYREPVTLAAPPLVLMTAHSEPWTSMHFPGNFPMLPEEVRKVFLERAMHRLNRSGWLIVQNSEDTIHAEMGRNLAKDFDEVYKPDIVLDFGSYSATRYLVKDSPSANRHE